tara:strand:- start:162 stop:773 length:612 start_codon:yes stop_codon:yes gene_type:complete
MRSFSEIETISKRSSRAAGFSWGVSEEIGKSIRFLELFGFPGIKNLNQYFNHINKNRLENINLILKNNKPLSSFFCPINLGVVFIDKIYKLENLKKIKFKKIAYPLLLIPFLSRGSEIIGKKILLKFDKNQFLFNFNINISSNFIKKNFPRSARNIEIFFIENKDNFEASDWKNLYRMSEKTFVEENEKLKKSAAGAGLTDND